MREEELTNLITEYGKDIFSFCLRLYNTRYEAEELYQETFLKLIEKSKEIDRSKNPKSFIISIAIGIYRNQKKNMPFANGLLQWKNLVIICQTL